MQNNFSPTTNLVSEMDAGNDARKLPAETLPDLSPEVRKLLDELRPEEIEALRSFARLGKEGVTDILEAVKLAQSLRTVGRFGKAVFYVVSGGLLGGVFAAREIAAWINWLRGGPQ